ncbi:hypothetical protein BDP27DRAFT_1369685 [Rhodocollybia butyracea]|uniref:Uncharacterized protein n=1 Tax=Rhodocollybia butyracea TaxID=206335 RepID=A0A9P5PDM3_9AGAR|nr:hypothetical protein BDP27DRAFT_1369685 [Rhodocollybia butyracea]
MCRRKTRCVRLIQVSKGKKDFWMATSEYVIVKKELHDTQPSFSSQYPSFVLPFDLESLIPRVNLVLVLPVPTALKPGPAAAPSGPTRFSPNSTASFPVVASPCCPFNFETRKPTVQSTSSCPTSDFLFSSPADSRYACALPDDVCADVYAQRNYTTNPRSQCRTHSPSHIKGRTKSSHAPIHTLSSSPTLPLLLFLPTPLILLTSPSLNVHIPSPQSEPVRSRTQSRLKALRQGEEEAARRREQEEIDMELVMRLDQEEVQREEREQGRERQQQERERHQQHQEQEKPAAAALPPPPPPKYLPPPPYVIVQDEARRKAQEAKDAELARQLDLELNRG